MSSIFRIACLAAAFCAFLPPTASAQIETGSIAGFVFDPSGAPFSGATVVLKGEKLIGGEHPAVTDRTGLYRFDRLPPGSYELTVKAQGHKTIHRSGVIVDAAFTATVNLQLEPGSAEETVTIDGASPVDSKGVVQQAVMDQQIFEGVPTGRDPWSVGKNMPGGQSGKYDVGGTQGMQQSNLSAHGSNTDDKIFSIDGLVINWPGSGGGATMIYYGHGMFEQSNYTTSGIPAEALTGGVYINMVTKEGGNNWQGEAKYYYSNDDLQAENHTGSEDLDRWKFEGGNPIVGTWDLNIVGGGGLKKDSLWLFGEYRRWLLDQLTLGAKNPDGTPALDDNLIRNYMGKVTWQASPNQKLSYMYNRNLKDRFHRRNTPPDYVEDRATLRQENPAYSTQLNYTGTFGDLVLAGRGGIMKGETDYYYQDEVQPTSIRREDPIRNTATVAAQYHNEQPNYRASMAGDLSYFKTGFGGDHLIKGGFQYGRLYMNNQYWVNGDMYLRFLDGVPTEVTIFNTPTAYISYVNLYGFFLQDSWVIGTKLSLNLGFRYDWDRGIIPEQSNPAGTFIGERQLQGRDVLKQSLPVWRAGIVYDPFGDGKTAIKASASRYGRQIGVRLVEQVHQFQFSRGNRRWTDLNADEMAQMNELGPFEGFKGTANRYADPYGPDWPYSDEFMAGIERELFKDFRVGVVYFYRTNRKEIGYRNVSVPPSAYTPVTVQVPSGAQGPGGTATFYNMDRAYLGLQDLVFDNEDILDTDYNGVEINFKKRMSNRWQIMGGFTFGRNWGGPMSATASDLNDPNISLIFPEGIVGDDAKFMSKFSGTYTAPWDITVSGSVLYNNGYPYQSQYNISRTVFPGLTRSSQTIVLSERGEERLDNVFMTDIRFSRPFDLGGGRTLEPQVELFNITNSNAITRLTTTVGSSWLRPAEILAPRIIRFGFSLKF